MAKFTTGNMWSTFSDRNTVFCITTNSVIKSNGELVMGKGIALEAKEKIPSLAKVTGEILKQMGNPSVYGFIVVNHIGFFQTKVNWRDNSDVLVIAHSANMLSAIAAANPDVTYNLNFPGIGCGNLNREIVMRHLIALPNNVTIWERY